MQLSCPLAIIVDRLLFIGCVRKQSCIIFYFFFFIFFFGLFSACAAFNLQAISAIIQHKACPIELVWLPDHRGRTCLHVLGSARENLATTNPDYNPVYETVDLILNKCPKLLTQLDAEGNTPLHSSAQAGNRSVLRSLLTSNLCDESVIAMENKQGFTARQVKAEETQK